MKHSNTASNCFKKYEKFFILMCKEDVHKSNKFEAINSKKLIAELLSVYIQNNDSFPSMFYLNGCYSEDVIASTISKLCDGTIDWVTNATPPRPNKKFTCVKMAEQRR